MAYLEATSAKPTIQLAGFLISIAIHSAAIFALWHYQQSMATDAPAPISVTLIKAEPPPPKEMTPTMPAPPPKTVKLVKKTERTPPAKAAPAVPQPTVITTNSQTPAVIQTMVSETANPNMVNENISSIATPVLAIAKPAPEPAAPLVLSSDLAVACPQRIPPEYPAASRRLREQGRVVLKVELDETGSILSVKVKESSGYQRLDEAGIEAIKQWHCNPPSSDGGKLHVFAFQPFNFSLENRQQASSR